MTTTRENIKAVAEEICHLANLGGTLHPNDIIPDIEKLIAARDAAIRDCIKQTGDTVAKSGALSSDYHKGYADGNADALQFLV